MGRGSQRLHFPQRLLGTFLKNGCLGELFLKKATSGIRFGKKYLRQPYEKRVFQGTIFEKKVLHGTDFEKKGTVLEKRVP